MSLSNLKYVSEMGPWAGAYGPTCLREVKKTLAHKSASNRSLIYGIILSFMQ